MSFRRLSRRRLEDIIYNFNKLRNHFNSLRDTCVIVEGYSDYQVLKQLNFNTPIYIINSLKFKEIYERNYERIVILTDWDREGIKIYERLKYKLSSLGFLIDDYSRDLFIKTLKLFGSSVYVACKNLIKYLMDFKYEI